MNQRCHRRQLRSELTEGFEVEVEVEQGSMHRIKTSRTMK